MSISLKERWSPGRKAAVVAAITDGSLSLEVARRDYALSPEELAAWQRDLVAYGIPGLRSTRLQIYPRRPR